jgi:hypothetical protein
MQVKYKLFRGSLVSWEQLFAQAAEFASSIGPTLVINISHAVAGQDGTVAVWYWETDETDSV